MPDQQGSHNSVSHHQNHCISEQFIMPELTTTTNITNATAMIGHDHEFYDDNDGGENSLTMTNIRNESTTIKQVFCALL